MLVDWSNPKAAADSILENDWGNPPPDSVKKTSLPSSTPANSAMALALEGRQLRAEPTFDPAAAQRAEKEQDTCRQARPECRGRGLDGGPETGIRGHQGGELVMCLEQRAGRVGRERNPLRPQTTGPGDKKGGKLK